MSAVLPRKPSCSFFAYGDAKQVAKVRKLLGDNPVKATTKPTEIAQLFAKKPAKDSQVVIIGGNAENHDLVNNLIKTALPKTQFLHAVMPSVEVNASIESLVHVTHFKECRPRDVNKLYLEEIPASEEEIEALAVENKKRARRSLPILEPEIKYESESAMLGRFFENLDEIFYSWTPDGAKNAFRRVKEDDGSGQHPVWLLVVTLGIAGLFPPKLRR